MSNQKDWRSELAQWKERNQPQTPPELQALLDDFTRQFPRESLATMPLETYAAGKPNDP